MSEDGSDEQQHFAAKFDCSPLVFLMYGAQRQGAFSAKFRIPLSCIPTGRALGWLVAYICCVSYIGFVLRPRALGCTPSPPFSHLASSCRSRHPHSNPCASFSVWLSLVCVVALPVLPHRTMSSEQVRFRPISINDTRYHMYESRHRRSVSRSFLRHQRLQLSVLRTFAPHPLSFSLSSCPSLSLSPATR